MSALAPEPNEVSRDTVTGLPGRETARVKLAEWLAQGEPVHAMLIGLRRFDAVNSAFGNLAGDSALLEISQRLRHFAGSELDGPWLVARSSGGQFLLIASEGCSRERWQFLAGQLLEALARPILAADGNLRLSPRGVLLRGVVGESAEVILARLGQSLARIMEGANKRLAWADGEITRAGRSASQLEADLLAAIDRDEIAIVFQPQFDCRSERLCGAEALARWNHPVVGRIGAGPLFAVAERADHVEQLSRHIASRALTLASQWPEPLRLSLNITPQELGLAGFADDLMRLTHETGFDATRLTLEVTEQVLVGDLSVAADILHRVTSRGIRIALDDFGAGFCNFRYLKVLPLDYLKLDRSMVEGIVQDPRDLAVLRAILAMGQALGLKTIAEGIESEDQRALVAAEGCDFYQGFLRAAPMGAAEFLAMAMLAPTATGS